jgi:molybdopterin-guanine dinucleotide biosynthesis protein A
VSGGGSVAEVDDGAQPLGAVLAGGAAVRLGGSKATVDLAGRPLIAYPLAAFAGAGLDAIVVAKANTDLPSLDVPVVTEPAEPRHPLLGLVTALEHADGRPIVACPCDTPFVTATLLTTLATTRRTAIVHDGLRLHPLLARYLPSDLPALRRALEVNHSATSAAESLNPRLIEANPDTTFNVNTPEDLAQAAAKL